MREKINQVTLINGLRHTSTHCASMQQLNRTLNFQFTPISNVYMMEVDGHAWVYAGRFIMVIYDYTRTPHPWSVQKISHRTITTDFQESFSLN